MEQLTYRHGSDRLPRVSRLQSGVVIYPPDRVEKILGRVENFTPAATATEHSPPAFTALILLRNDPGAVMIQIKRILCPVDFSEFSRHALDEAIAIAHLYDACVTGLHVFPEAIAADPFSGLPEFQPFRLTDRHRAHLLEHLKTFATSEGAESRRMDFAIREGVDIHAEILEAADQMKPDLIVMGTHGRSGFQHLMLGSVAEKVLHGASCPVLTVPRKAPEAVSAGPAPFTRILCGIDFSDCSLAALEYATSLASQSGAHLDVLSVVQLIPMYEMTGAVPLVLPGTARRPQG